VESGRIEPVSWPAMRPGQFERWLSGRPDGIGWPGTLVWPRAGLGSSSGCGQMSWKSGLCGRGISPSWAQCVRSRPAMPPDRKFFTAPIDKLSWAGNVRAFKLAFPVFMERADVGVSYGNRPKKQGTCPPPAILRWADGVKASRASCGLWESLSRAALLSSHDHHPTEGLLTVCSSRSTYSDTSTLGTGVFLNPRRW